MSVKMQNGKGSFGGGGNNSPTVSRCFLLHHPPLGQEKGMPLNNSIDFWRAPIMGARGNPVGLKCKLVPVGKAFIMLNTGVLTGIQTAH